jgi:hypothetical protein
LLLDLANIIGGLLLASALLQEIPRIGTPLGRLGALIGRAAPAIGVLALAAGGYYLILHLTSGPHVFHFELVGLGVGVALLRERLFPRSAGSLSTSAARAPAPGPQGYIDTRVPPPGSGAAATRPAPAPSGAMLLLAVFGLIAIVVGVQGLLTPDG